MKPTPVLELLLLGNRLSKLRKAKGLSMEKFAYEASVSKGNVCDIEGGRRNPRYCTLRSLASALDISVAQLLNGL